MKKALFVIASCLVSTMMSAQFEVQSTGFSTSSNLVMDGVMGVANGKVTLSASEFAAGIYIYSLVINNQVVDSKRMTLTD